MSNQPLRSLTPAIDIYIKLAQYPILSDQIRVRMREELFDRGIVEPADFEQEVKELAIESQRREGILAPHDQEDSGAWETRIERVRELHTDATFADNLGSVAVEQLIAEVMGNQPGETSWHELTFNPEVAPWELLFRQGEIYEAMPLPEREAIDHHLEEIKVVLIKRMISDQLPFIGVAKRVFDIADLRKIYRRRIGRGKIGGKAAGMALAWKILQRRDPELGPDLSGAIDIPESFFVGTEVIYEFMLENRLEHFMNQKYRPIEEVRAEYPNVVEAYLQGVLPEPVVEQIREVLERVRGKPLIVRSSSLLEDNFGFSFAGKYKTFFCPNNGSDRENLKAVLDSIRLVYASTLGPDVLLYRKKNGLLDYDERMAILLQEVKGERYGRYYLPSAAGVAYSQNPFRWDPDIRSEDGFLRLVWGLGTRAVTRIGPDYPRLVALSHPTLRPEMSAESTRRYSQWYVDVIDLEDNAFKSLPVEQVLRPDYPHLRLLASLDKGEYLQEIVAAGSLTGDERYVLTFDGLTGDRRFIKLMRTVLIRLEQGYGIPVDVEFTVEFGSERLADYQLNVLQCRPLSQAVEDFEVVIPEEIDEGDMLFSSSRLVPHGRATDVRYIVFVDPVAYQTLPSEHVRLNVARAVGRINLLLEGEPYLLIGPGRWGSTNVELGVPVTYADICNASVLIEIGDNQNGQLPELSYGTHFFQDLVETGISSLPLHLGPESGRLNWDFLRQSTNSLAELSPADSGLEKVLRVIDLDQVTPGRRVSVLMNGQEEAAVGFLAARS